MSKPFTLGAELTLVTPGGRYRERQETAVRINKVGRKYFYVEPIEELRYFQGGQFSLEDGYETGDYSQFRRRCTTPELLAAEDHRGGVAKALHTAGIRFDYGIERELTTEQLEALLKAIGAKP